MLRIFNSTIFFTIGLFLQVVFARPYDYRLENFSLKDGFRGGAITSFVKDHDGYLWMRTEEGIAIFDGYTFNNLKYDPNNPKSIFQKVDRSGLSIDKRGNIWITYQGKGLSYFDKEIDKFVHYKPDASQDENYIGNRNVLTCHFASADSMWVGTEEGLFLFDYQTKVFSHIKQTDQLAVRSLLLDKAQNLWIGTGLGMTYDDGQGLFFYDLSNNSIQKIGTSSAKINQILQDAKGRIWLATNHGLGRIRGYSPGFMDYSEIYFDLTTIEFNRPEDAHRNNIWTMYESTVGDLWLGTSYGIERVENPNAIKPTIRTYCNRGKVDFNGQVVITHICEDTYGNIWVNSRNKHYGLMKYVPNEDRFDTNIEQNVLQSGDEGFTLISMMIDEENIIWSGSERRGLLKLDLEQKQFHTLKSLPGNSKTLSSDIIFSFVEDREQAVWIGTSAGLNKYDPTTRRIEIFNSRNYGMNADLIQSAYLDMEGRMWLGHNPHQVSRIKLENWDYSPFKYIIGEDTTAFFAWSVRSIAGDHEGNIWIASDENGLFKSIRGERSFQKFAFPNVSDHQNLTINDIYIDDDNQVWLATTYGLYSVDKKRGNLIEIEAFEGKRRFREGIQTICPHDAGLWLGTQSAGLVNLDLSDNTIQRFNKSDGLPDNTIESILVQNDSILWLSTNEGLCRFNYLQRTSTNYTVSDGLPSNNFNTNSALKSSNGTMYFGTSSGLVFFHPDEIHNNPYHARPTLTELQLFNQKISAGDTINKQVVLTKSLSSSDLITLNHKNNVFTIGFSSMHFASPSNNLYAYKLDGLESDWNYVTADRRIASYAGLPQGTYTFSVKATNSDGVWSPEIASVVIEILPPWWSSSWFRFFMLLVLVFLIYVLFLLRTRAINRRNQALSQMVEEKTEDLSRQNLELQEMANKLHEADQSKIRFLMNISHEFRTPLSLILGPVTDLIKSPRLNDNEKEDVKIIERNGHRLLRLTNQIMDLNELDKDALKLQVAKGDIVSFCKDIAHAFDYRAEHKDINYKFESSETSYQGWFDGDKIEKILYNLISNAMKFTPSRGSVRVKLHIEDEKLRVVVEDSGIGLSKNQSKQVFDRFYQVEDPTLRRSGTGIGLNLTRNLVEKHKGQIFVSSTKGHGSSFSLEIPLSKAKFSPAERIENQIDVNQRVEEIQKLFVDKGDQNLFQSYDRDKNLVVLLVEDSVDMRQYLRSKLQSSFSIFEAEDGEKAVRIAEEIVPDLILSDIMMPVMDGITLCQTIKSNEFLSAIPVILLTARAGEESQLEGYEVGADEYIKKPVDINLLKSRILNLIESRRKLRNSYSSSAQLVPEELIDSRQDEIFLNKAIKIVEQNISDPNLNYTVFTEKLGMSKTRLYDKINALTGQSINLFIRTIRLKIASQMIRSMDFNFSEISYKVGFSDPGYFSKCFKKQFNLSPKEFAESLNNEMNKE